MRLVIARCSVDYIGRLTAHLPMATRLIMVKQDGSVSIHSDDRAYKPLNWMSCPCTLVEDDESTWTVHNPKGERLVITLEQVHCGACVSSSPAARSTTQVGSPPTCRWRRG